MEETKIKLHKELNDSFSKLSRICLVLGLSACNKDFKKSRSFMSRMIDNSKIKNV